MVSSIPPKTNKVTDVSDSLIGYEFQFLWAARRALRLIYPRTTLTQIISEGVHPKDEIDLGSGPEAFLGVDISEYHGGNTAKQASQIVISQLKYSKKNPNRKWTTAKVCTGKKGRAKSSLVGRLSKVFVSYFDKLGSKETLGKVRIKIVTNRPIDKNLLTTIERVQSQLRGQNRPPHQLGYRHLVLEELTKEQLDSIGKIYKTSGLRSNAFAIFLLCLDLSDFESEPFHLLRLRLHEEMSSFDAQAPADSTRNLCNIVRETALSTIKRPIRKNHVYACLGTSEKEFFPAPSLIDIPEKVITTIDSGILAKVLAKNETRRVLVYGGAGIGKSVTLSTVHRKLPTGSEVIIYDCFAKGQTKTPNRQRYPEEVALTQIVNEVALKTQNDVYLFRNRADSHTRWDRLETVIKLASDKLKSMNALLVIIVDAADNAIISYCKEKANKRPTFLPNLWNLDLPENARLVISCRSHRKDMLDYPKGLSEIELKGFTKKNSIEYLSQRFPKIENETGERFHRATHGIPRVQYYWLQDLEKRSPKDALKEIEKRQVFGLHDLYTDWLNAASTLFQTGNDSKLAMGILMAQARPINAAVFAKAQEMPEEKARQYMLGLSPGLILNKEKTSALFRDEDFETHLEDAITDSMWKQAHFKLADFCVAHVEDGEYGSQEVARHLYESHRFDELIKITIENRGLSAISNSYTRVRCAITRCALALRSAFKNKNIKETCQLLFLAAEALQSRKMHRNALLQFPELVIAHGELNALIEACESLEWGHDLGKRRLQLAAELAFQRKSKRRCLEHYRMGKAWIDKELTGARTRNGSHSVDVKDVMQLTATHLFIGSVHSAKWNLRRWRPRSLCLSVVYQFFRMYAGRMETKEIHNIFLKSTRISLVRATILGGVFRPGWKWNKLEVGETLDKLFIWIHRYEKRHKLVGEWLLPFLEFCAFSGANKEKILKLLDFAPVSSPRVRSRVWHFSDWYRNWDEFVRVATLRASLTNDRKALEELLEAPNAADSKVDNRDEEELISQFKRLIPIYSLRADCLNRRRRLNTVSRELKKLLGGWIHRAEGVWYKGDELFNVFIDIAVDTLLMVSGTDFDLISKIVDNVEVVLKRDPIYTWLSIVERLGPDKRFHEKAGEILEKVRDFSVSKEMKSSEEVEILMRCASNLMVIDNERSKDFYKMALNTATGIGEDFVWFNRATTDLANYSSAGIDENSRIPLARSLIKTIDKQYDSIGEDSTIPWGEIVATITKLTPSIGIRCVQDWDNKGWIKLEDIADGLVTGFFEGEHIDSSLLVPLLEIGGQQNDPTTMAIPIMKSLWNSNRTTCLSLFDSLSKQIGRDLPYSRRASAAERLLAWANERNLKRSSVSELKSILEFYSQVLRGASLEYSHMPSDKKEEQKVLDLLKRIKRAPESVLQNLEQDVLEARPYLRGANVQLILDELALRLSGKNRIIFLDALVGSISKISYLENSYIESFIKILNNWSQSVAVKRWATEGLTNLFETLLPKIAYLDRGENDPFERLLNLPILSVPATEIILNVLAKNLDQFTSTFLYSFVPFITKKLSTAESTEVCFWALNKYGLNSDSLEEDNLAFNHSMEPLPYLIYSLLNNPDNRIRWRVIHTARKLISIQTEPLLGQLVNLSNEKSGDYWMSAREWLLFLFLHLSRTMSFKLVRYVQVIASHALDEEFPHAGIQELAKRTVLNVEAETPNTITKSELKKIQQVNEPRQVFWPRAQDLDRSREPKRKWSEWRFDFNTMDTFPYWYSPLSHCFNLHRCDVAERAEKWICDGWGQTSEESFKDYRQKTDRYSWELIDHRHGSHPTVEYLGTYLERHAMFMAAGEMIRELPILDEKENYSSWHEWNSRHFFEADPHITSRIIDGTPLKSELFDFWSPLDKWLNISDEEFERELGLLDSNWKSTVAAGEITLSAHDRRAVISVSSALVSPDTASSLLRALECMESPVHYSLPIWGISFEQNVDEIKKYLSNLSFDDCHSDMRMTEPEFRLMPWVVRFHSERELHGMDERWPSDGRSWYILGEFFLKALSISAERDYQKYFNRDGSLAAWSEVWDDSKLFKNDSEVYSEGHRLWVAREELVQFLRTCGMDLIWKVWIKRHDKNSKKWQYEHGKARIFILRQSGKIEDLERSR